MLPGDRRVEKFGRLIAQEANVYQNLDHLGESLVAEGAADDCLGFGDGVTLAERSRVTVRVSDKGESRVDEVGLCRAHEVRTSYADDFSILVELGIIAQRK